MVEYSRVEWGQVDPSRAMVDCSRAVEAGPASPAATGPIFGQLTRAKMPYELWWVVQLLL